ncbi:MAG: glycosyltransferase family 2 protein [Burkholderiales bacterium]
MHDAMQMRLDLLIPTLRRPPLLKRALASIARAEPPRRLQVAVIVINNDTQPELPGLDSTVASLPFPTRVVYEPVSGKSAALNAGIALSTADYVGFIDDDEELAAHWFRTLEDALEGGRLDFVGGPALPLAGVETPAWIPPDYSAVLGLADGGPEERPYGRSFPGMLMGGNAVISRSMLTRVGGYSSDLGPRRDLRLFSCEDEDMYWRLVDAGAEGRYLPRLIVYHHLHPERLRRNYYRAWCFWNGASKGVLSRRRPPTVPQIAGVPRYVFGDVTRKILAWLRASLRGRPGHLRMAAELAVWHLAGRLYGRHWNRAPRLRRAPDLPSKSGNQTMATL